MDTPRWTQPYSQDGQGVPPDASYTQSTGDYIPPQGEVPKAPDYPFEEPEHAPELLGARSDNLYSRSEPFWNRVVELPREGEEYPRDPNYWNHPEVLAEDDILSVTAREKGGIGARAVKKVLIIAGVLLAVMVILFSALFQVRSIRVEGNTTVSAEEIIRLSGLSTGMNTFAIDEDAVSRRIESNRYLRCLLVDVQGMDSVIIRVRERVPAAVINHNGLRITMDNRGWVLEESLDANGSGDDLVFVSGLDVRRCDLGQAISLNNATQLTVYNEILVELKAMGQLSLLKELDLSSMDSIYLETRDGFNIRLGSSSLIHQKLRSMLITREEILSRGYLGGTIDVSDPVKPTFIPEGLE
ncbi:MAG: FtsQ-type POTRA domain-containing protein [Clostridia bacterium]|nr:FtsQ-type POTRA domain-containing protein [Clostridia bacterium]